MEIYHFYTLSLFDILSCAGKERLALLQTQKEQARLEKILLQLQRELRELEQAHKATRLGSVLIMNTNETH